MDHEERYLEAVTAAEAEVSRVLVTLLFTDIVGSTEHAAKLGDRAWMRLVEAHHATVRGLITRFDGREVDCAGDGFFATFGTASSAIGCGDAITTSVRSLGLEVRAGLHTGECEHLRWTVQGDRRAHGGPSGQARTAGGGPGHGHRTRRGGRVGDPLRGPWFSDPEGRARAVAAVRRRRSAAARPAGPRECAERWSAQQDRVARWPEDRRVLGHENRPERMNPRLRRGFIHVACCARALHVVDVRAAAVISTIS